MIEKLDKTLSTSFGDRTFWSLERVLVCMMTKSKSIYIKKNNNHHHRDLINVNVVNLIRISWQSRVPLETPLLLTFLTTRLPISQVRSLREPKIMIRFKIFR